MKILYLIIILALINSCFSQSNITLEDLQIKTPIKYVKKGEVVSNEGFLVDKEQMKEFRLINESLKLEKDKSGKLTDLNEIQTHRTELYKKQAEEFQKAYEWSETKSFWKSSGYFLLGSFITGIISYGVVKTIK